MKDKPTKVEIKVPLYNDAVLQLMMFYPTLYPNEFSAQQALFTESGTVEVDVERRTIVMGRHDIVKKSPDRTKASILGNNPQRDERDRKNWENFGAERDCYFSQIGRPDVDIISSQWNTRKEWGYGVDIFNAMLAGKVDLPPHWKQQLSFFCYLIVHRDPDLYRHTLWVYCRSYYSSGWQDWLPRYWNSFVTLRDAAQKIRDIINPPRPSSPPQVDWAARNREFCREYEDKIKADLVELESLCLKPKP